MCNFLYTSILLLVLSFPYFGNNLWFWETWSRRHLSPMRFTWEITLVQFVMAAVTSFRKGIDCSMAVLKKLCQPNTSCWQLWHWQRKTQSPISYFQCILHCPNHKYISWFLINKYLLMSSTVAKDQCSCFPFS